MSPEELLKVGAIEPSAQMRALEADTPPAELGTWAAAFEDSGGMPGELGELEGELHVFKVHPKNAVPDGTE